VGLAARDAGADVGWAGRDPCTLAAADYFAEMRAGRPARRIGTLDDIAQAILSCRDQHVSHRLEPAR
jgi:hypothetical protein